MFMINYKLNIFFFLLNFLTLPSFLHAQNDFNQKTLLSTSSIETNSNYVQIPWAIGYNGPLEIIKTTVENDDDYYLPSAQSIREKTSDFIKKSKSPKASLGLNKLGFNPAYINLNSIEASTDNEYTIHKFKIHIDLYYQVKAPVQFQSKIRYLIDVEILSENKEIQSIQFLNWDEPNFLSSLSRHLVFHQNLLNLHNSTEQSNLMMNNLKNSFSTEAIRIALSNTYVQDFIINLIESRKNKIPITHLDSSHYHL